LEVFTYKDYINSIHTFRLKNNTQLAEETEKYYIKNPIENKGNELIKTILKDKRKVAYLYNKYLKPKEKIYSNNLIDFTNMYKLKDIIIYKIKNKQIYLMIKHQKDIDYNITYKVLEYSVNIIQTWKKSQRYKYIKTYPIIVPIIIYTGKEKWNINKKDQKEPRVTTYMKNRIDLNYNLISAIEDEKLWRKIELLNSKFIEHFM